MSKIHFKTKLFKIHDWTILNLPMEASAQLPSRGMTMVEGTINGTPFKAPLEPDGNNSHWFRVDEDLSKAARVKPGDTVTLEIEPLKVWFRPEAPQDLAAALAKEPKAKALWKDITPKAQWEWIRWMRATNYAETRQKRIGVAISKLNSGMRRPCCFNARMCSETYVSRNGVLLEPATTTI